MKRDKITAILYFICSILWATSAVISAMGSNISMCAVYIGLSVTFFCLGMLYRRRVKNDRDKSDDK